MTDCLIDRFTSELCEPIASFVGSGVTSKKEISVQLFKAEPGTGIVFAIPDSETNTGKPLFLPATADNVVNTLRNVVIGRGKSRLCLVEHILCAIALSNLDDLYIAVDGPEVPLGNGSGDLWLALLKDANLITPLPKATIELPEPILINRKDRSMMAIPDETFSVTYMMDWKHPKIGRVWRTWTTSDDIADILDARTFGSLAEHKMLGLEKDMVSLTEDGFTMDLRFDDEPVRHKLLDFIGDLMLCGINPLKIKARFISVKGGHEMDVVLAKQLRQTLKLG
ncbi:MAG: UDP-3-O-acyl-N-acetylglucosamine deacetylase [Candidatus Obscuribacterales bacterium]|nr:UDP-3-O-acyl-N-acetylglucosamine deacetylase [Candidatus Obscuribacterales bacterium]